MPAGMREGMRFSSSPSTPTAPLNKEDKSENDTGNVLLLSDEEEEEEEGRSEEEDNNDNSSSVASPHRNRAGIN
jgi:hypothetical protein